MDPSVPTNNSLSLAGMMKALKGAVANENLTPQQAAEIRRNMGISNSYFTTKKVNPAKRKRANKAAKQARKVMYKNGFKGQKMTKGKR